MAGTVVFAIALTGCATSPSATGSASRSGSRAVITLVAAENFWGSIAAQLGGTHVAVTSIIDRPDADPHAYEPTTADARAIATADVVLVNGLGYDSWASKSAAANADPARTVITVGEVIGAKDGDNPHRWYNPGDVAKVADALTTVYKRHDPQDAVDLDTLRATFDTTNLADYHAAIADIKAHYAGTRIGASESIVAMIAPALGLNLITPPGFMNAISEGIDPTAEDKVTADSQISGHLIKVFLFNSQNATPDVTRQVEAAKAAGISVASVTETLVPSNASWEQWQTAQLLVLRDALAMAATR